MEESKTEQQPVLQTLGGKIGLAAVVLGILGAIVMLTMSPGTTLLYVMTLWLMVLMSLGIMTITLLMESHPVWCFLCILFLPIISQVYLAVIMNQQGILS